MQLPGCKFVPASVATVVSLDPPRIRSPQSRQLTNPQEVEFNDFSMFLALVALFIRSIYIYIFLFLGLFLHLFGVCLRLWPMTNHPFALSSSLRLRR